MRIMEVQQNLYKLIIDLTTESQCVHKIWPLNGWGESLSTVRVGRNTRNCIQYFLTVELFTFCTCCILRCLVCIVVVV